MGVPENAIQSGILELYEDDDDTLVDAVRKFNDYETDCRIDYKKAEGIFVKFCAANPLLAIIFTLVNFNYIFTNKVLTIILLASWVIVYFVFVLFNRLLIIGTVATAALALLDLTFLLFFVLDAFITVLYEKLDHPLRKNPTYPRFNKIDIKYRRGKRSEYHDPRDRL